MDDGFDLHAELAAGVRDAAGAWRFVRLFAASYASPVLAGDGCDDEELRAAEARLGFPLPASLREAYALIGRRFDLTGAQDRLLAPDEVTVDDTGQVLVFRVENQHVAQWGIPLSAVTEPDPPVVFRLESVTRAERAWQPFLDRVSLACVEMALSEWMLSGGVYGDNRELDDDAIALLEEQFRRLPMPDYPLWAAPGGRPMRWFDGLGAILREDAGQWLWVRAASADRIAAVRRALPGEWLMDEG
ncbi:SMI1/KNR4 family protein [Plantactinospora sp. S1510]|uniref:SMI1/KNR4 family protein n=1 Tax=Plantactinospora alkalitolerans TaxID=2789879 RepID=A0ABS0H2H4_9ACTN|nr:SMI1/KNR4 family protein [Plantactinospora alkalitolerans]MBF9132667.1 SMI1/KNR4 family protein [Plantactinospora alkalitolerans]